MYAIITENDESKWGDVTGEMYHFPSRYLKFLQPGTKVIYYKGVIKNSLFKGKRLSPSPRYFAKAVIGKSFLDSQSTKKDYYCAISQYLPFKNPVIAKKEDSYIEEIPESRKVNYWRDGVREINKRIYEAILESVELLGSPNIDQPIPALSEEFESQTLEGDKKYRYSSYYERRPIYRRQAVEIHGVTCMGCSFNFEETFGNHGRNYIHVHHVKPVSEFTSAKIIDPRTDMIVLCPNCHSMVHRNKGHTLSLMELKELMDQ